MKRQKLELYQMRGVNQYRAVFKTKHGRVIYLQLSLSGNQLHIADCHYIDRPSICRPKKLVSTDFSKHTLLDVIACELDRKFYGVNYITDSQASDDYHAFIARCQRQFHTKYKFLIMVGEGAFDNGLPAVLTTRFKNRVHRSIYLKVRRHPNGYGVVEACRYFDRKYHSEQTHITPPSLRTIFFPYNRDALVRLVNTELNADFTNIICVTDGSIDVEHIALPLCGNV